MFEHNKMIISQLYDSLQRGDGEAMAQLYHPEAIFVDPAFGELRGSQIGDMWKMLTSRANNMQVRCERIVADDSRGEASWVATYLFSKTGRMVENRVKASFAFKDGKIISHRDQFNFYLWARQALGWLGFLLGWNPLFQAKLRRTFRSLLASYQSATNNGH